MNSLKLSNKIAGWRTAVVLTLGLTAAAFAGKGGNGKGNGGGGNGGGGSGVNLVAAPVEYRVTWLDVPGLAPGTFSDHIKARDVNSAGVAVGYLEQGTTSEKHVGCMADADGNFWNLNNYFAEALLAYPGETIDYALEVNKVGQVACLLVPDSYNGSGKAESVTIVVGDIVGGSLTTAGVFVDTNGDGALGGDVSGFGWGIRDLAESGDLLIQYYNDLYVYRFPFTDAPEVVPGPQGLDRIVRASFNDAGEVFFSAEVTTTTTVTRGKKTTTQVSTARRAYFSTPDGSLVDYGVLYDDPDNLVVGLGVGVSEGGDLYANVDGAAKMWSPTAGWERIAPYGYVEVASKAAVGEEVVIYDRNDAHTVFQRGLGAFVINVTSGLNGAADAALWNLESASSYYTYPHFNGISRPNASGSGCICGLALIDFDGGGYYFQSFILTPVQP